MRTASDVKAAPPAHSGYAADPVWRKIQQFLPEELRFTDTFQPVERYWDWRGHAVHLDQFENPAAPARVVLLHGVGSNGRQLSLIVGGPLFKRGYETIALDLPTFGRTRVARGAPVTYDDWVQLVVDFVATERRRDGRPIVLFGLSAGGMLTYHAAAISCDVAGIVGSTFLDERAPLVRDTTVLNLMTSRVTTPLAGLIAATPLGGLKMPIRLASKMHTLVNDRAALKIFLSDRTSAGNWATVRFLSTYMDYRPAVAPEDFDVCPILLTQPAADRWTPLALSELTLRRIKKVPVSVVMLGNAGHFPLEQPGLTQMVEAIDTFIGGL